MYSNLVFQHHPDYITELERRIKSFDLIVRHEAANKGVIKIINDANLRQFIYDMRQSFGRFGMIPLDYQPAYELPRDFFSYLPQWLVQVVQQINHQTKLDHLTATMAILGAVSIALCGRYIIEDNENGWHEAICLYIMLIAPPGSSKSALIEKLKSILRELMEELQEEYDRTAPERRHAAKMKQKFFDRRIDVDVRARVKENRKKHTPGNFRELMDEAEEYSKATKEIQEEISSDIPGARPSLFTGDFTLAGLIDAQVKQGCHQAFMEDEGMIFEKINSTGLWRERGFFSKAYDQAEYSQSKHEKHWHFKPSLNFLLATQPSVARKFFINESQKEQGLAFRFMPILSASNPNYNAAIHTSWWDYFKENLKRLLRENFTQDSKCKRKSISMERAGVEELLRFRAQNQNQAVNRPYMDGFLQKLHGMACRIAGVLHLWDSSPENPISYKTVESAIMITLTLIPHAEEVFSPSGFAAVKTALRIEKWFEKTGNISAKIHDINNGIGSDVKKQDIELGLERMMKFNRAAQVFDSENKPIYVINPQIVPDALPGFTPVALTNIMSPLNDQTYLHALPQTVSTTNVPCNIPSTTPNLFPAGGLF